MGRGCCGERVGTSTPTDDGTCCNSGTRIIPSADTSSKRRRPDDSRPARRNTTAFGPRTRTTRVRTQTDAHARSSRTAAAGDDDGPTSLDPLRYRTRTRRTRCTVGPREMPDVMSAGLHGRLLVAFSVVLAVVIAVPLVVSAGVPAAPPPSLAAGHDAPAVHFGGRVRRQLPPIEQGNQVIDNIFQIPISTLNAVGSLIKSTRPLVRRTRERIQQYYSGNQQQPSAVYSQQQQYGGSRPGSMLNYVSSYGNRPYYSSTSYNNRRKQQRNDPLPEGRHYRRGNDEDY